jgi:GTP diphosphokinase / guanosine-3',5'-bis(diphosphate) 3'-diphosphatase
MRNWNQGVDISTLIQSVVSYTGSPEAETVLGQAYQVAVEAHEGFQRINGKPYINHLLAVAGILARWHAPVHVVAAGLLHDILSLEYSRVRSLDNLRSQLDPVIFRKMEEISNLNSYMRHVQAGDFHSEAEASDFQYQIASFLQRDPDVVVIKIADRLHNVQGASELARPWQERMAGVVLTLLVPLTERLGMSMARYQLEDCCFELNNPGYYTMLEQHCLSPDLKQEVASVQQELHHVVNEALPGSSVRWHPSSLYSVGQDIGFARLASLDTEPVQLINTGSFIVLTNEEDDCYRLLRIIHKQYPPVRGHLRDFIADSKENGYQSLDTQVKHPSGKLLQVAIRTFTMDLIAEYGITASWWDVPQELLPRLPQEAKPGEKEIQVYTPKGEIKYLPQGSTVLDFAYHIHTEVGNQCASALVNGEEADLYRVLCNGDKVEILTGRPDSEPALTWLDYVQTPQALSRIRQSLAQYRRSEMAQRGRMLLDTELQPLGLDSTNVQAQQLLLRLAMKEHLNEIEDLYVSIGVGRHKPDELVKTLKSKWLKSARTPDYVDPGLDVIVLSPEEAKLSRVFARCCGPQPPDDIIGYRRSDDVLAIHKRSCPQAKQLEKLIQVKWGSAPMKSDYVIMVESLNRPGLASDISTLVTLSGIDMQRFSSYKRPDGVTAESHIYLGRTTSAQRNRLQKALEGTGYVNNVEIIHSSFLLTPTSESGSPRLIQPSNPYGPRLAEGSRFYGREIECERISTLLRDSTSNTAILIWGQKRIGKTSLVLRLKELAREDSLPVYIDMQGLKDASTAQFLHQLMNSISSALRNTVQDLPYELTVTPLHKLRKDPLAYFDNFMALVQDVARLHPLVVILDEFQCLCSLREEKASRSAIFSRMRSRSLHGQGIHLVLSGGGLLSQLTEQGDISSLFNITHEVKLGYLGTMAGHKLIKSGLTRVGSITELAIDLLLELTAGHPFYLQLLCSRLYEYAQEHKTMITQQVVTQNVQEWLAKADKSRFQHLWEGNDAASTQRNKLIMSAIAHVGTSEVEYSRLAEVLYPTIAEHELVRALEDLTDLGILKRDHLYYSITVKLFTRWLRLHWPLELALKEIHWS